MIALKIEKLGSFDSLISGRLSVIRDAASGAINDVAFSIKDRIKGEMSQTFSGGATRYSLSSFAVDKSVPSRLVAVVRLRDDSPGGKGTPFNKALAHLFTGGSRSYKRMEGAFRRIGVLGTGEIMVVPGADSWANPLDSFGNPRPSLIVQLISYFNAFGEQGFRANITEKRKRSIAKLGVTESGYKTINGAVYFVSRGRGVFFGREQHLPAGIWAKRNVHGVDVAPVFLFVRTGRYRQYFDLERIGSVVVSERWQRQFNRWLAFKM